MIADRETNSVYFSEKIQTDSRFTKTSDRIFSVFDSFGICYKILPNTNDIWSRDYMPIQINDSTYIEYRFDQIIYKILQKVGVM